MEDKIIKQKFIFIIFCLVFISACGGGATFVPGNYPIGPTFNQSATELRIFRAGETQALTVLEEVAPGEVVTLEVRGQPPGARPVWFSSDVSRGDFLRPGELQLRGEGRFEIRVHAGGARAMVPVVVTPATPDSDGTPTPTPSEDPEDPPATPTALPLPDPVNSDSFIDAVISFTPGPFAGFGSNHFPDIVLGPPRGGGALQGGLDVLSLGVGGIIVLKSDAPVLDGPGADFIIFENPFFIQGNPKAPYAELGEVAVSQDGVNFIEFSCDKENRPELYPGCAGVMPVLANGETSSIEPTDPMTAGGDGFDLEEAGLPWIRYIRIRDLSETGVGISAGFDLDAIAIIHQHEP